MQIPTAAVDTAVAGVDVEGINQQLDEFWDVGPLKDKLVMAKRAWRDAMVRGYRAAEGQTSCHDDEGRGEYVQWETDPQFCGEYVPWHNSTYYIVSV
jgi:hypothetical protein